jgi:hypothetical protein
MAPRLGEHRTMPDVPKQDFVDALAEIWFQISFAAYHMAYVRVYSQSEALRTRTDVLRDQEHQRSMFTSTRSAVSPWEL